jgi:hypothetical protein
MARLAEQRGLSSQASAVSTSASQLTPQHSAWEPALTAPPHPWWLQGARHLPGRHQGLCQLDVRGQDGQRGGGHVRRSLRDQVRGGGRLQGHSGGCCACSHVLAGGVAWTLGVGRLGRGDAWLCCWCSDDQSQYHASSATELTLLKVLDCKTEHHPCCQWRACLPACCVPGCVPCCHLVLPPPQRPRAASP